MSNNDKGPRLYGEVPKNFAVDDRIYEGIDANFDPVFFSPKKKKSSEPQPSTNPSILRKSSSNRFIRKEQRTLASLRNEWSDELKSEEEKITPLIADVIKIDKRVRAKFVSDLKVNMDSIEAFFITEVAPIEVALADALERSRQQIELLTDSEVEAESFNNIQAMFREAVRLKTFDFLCSKLQLPDRLRDILVDKHFKHNEGRRGV